MSAFDTRVVFVYGYDRRHRGLMAKIAERLRSSGRYVLEIDARSADDILLTAPDDLAAAIQRWIEHEAKMLSPGGGEEG